MNSSGTAKTTVCIDPDFLISTLGRTIIAFAAFAIPLVFCRESMYIFQVKTMILQYSGLSLMLLMGIHSLAFNKSPNIVSSWSVRLMLLFLCWQIFKTFDSLAPIYSWKVMSRIGWLPIIAISIPYFIRTRKQLEHLVNVVLVTSILAQIYMWVLYVPYLKQLFIGEASANLKDYADFSKVPILGDIAMWLIYPEEIREFTYKNLDSDKEPLLQMASSSFFAGKDLAGTFGNHNFLASYLNLTGPLFLYRAGDLLQRFFFNKAKAIPNKVIIGVVSVVLALLVFTLLILFIYFKNIAYHQSLKEIPNALLGFNPFRVQTFELGTTILILFFVIAFISVVSLLTWSKRQVYFPALAVFLVFIWGLSIVHIVQLQNRGSWMGLYFGLVTVVCFLISKIYFKNSRVGPVLLFAICLGIYLTAGLALIPLIIFLFFHEFFIREGHQNRVKAKLFLGIVFCLSVFALLLFGTIVQSPRYKERLKSIPSLTSQSNELRLHTWNSFFTAWIKDDEVFPSGSPRIASQPWRILTGFGSYNFRIVYPKYRSERIFQIENGKHNTETSHPHNEYLGYLCELGIIGILIYLIMIVLIFYALWSKNWNASSKTIFLVVAFTFMLSSLLVNQFVGVGVRYTGVAFQFWLTLGMALALAGTMKASNPKSKKSMPIIGKISGALVLFLGVVILGYGWKGSVSHPFTLFRSQHCYQVGQGIFHQLPIMIQNVQKKLQQDVQAAIQKAQVKPAQAEAHARQVQVRYLKSNRLIGSADQYFEQGYLYDASNYETLYIGAMMNSYLGRIYLHNKAYPEAEGLFKKAIDRLDRVLNQAPYFVQSKYWKGNCLLLRGQIILEKLRSGRFPDPNFKHHQKAESFFKEALNYMDLYSEQDPIYMDIFVDRYRIHYALLELYSMKKAVLESNLKAHPQLGIEIPKTQTMIEKALDDSVMSLKLCLSNYERGGYDVDDPELKLQFEKIAMQIAAISPKDRQDDILEAMQIVDRIREKQQAEKLLPFLPKTERHLKSSAYFFKEIVE